MNPVVALIRHIVLIWASGLALAWSGGCRADSHAPVSAPDAAAVLPAPRAPRQQVRHAPGQGIEDTVRRLTRGLDLDQAQQTKLREILWDEQRQARKLRENPAPGVNWPSATAAIVEQTKARIRAILTDAQKDKYSKDVPRDQAAPARADLQHWLQLQEAGRQSGDAASK